MELQRQDSHIITVQFKDADVVWFWVGKAEESQNTSTGCH
jgi:hypothetical protein